MNRSPFSPLPNGQRPLILFRVEHFNNSRFRDHNMVVMDFSLPTNRAFDNHLSWKRSNTPFISFFDSWEHALRRHKWWLARGKKNVIIVAIWAEDMCNLYSAQDVATALEYNNNSQDNRRRLANHRHEYLVWSGIAADYYRILAVFSGDGSERPVFLQSATYNVEATLPGDLRDNTARRDVTEELRSKLYSCTGIIDEGKYNALVRYLGGGDSDMR